MIQRKISLILTTLLVIFSSFCWSKTIKLACVGDSITHGARLRNRSQDCFPSKLAKLLGNEYKVGNFGIGGNAIKKGTKYSYNQPKKMQLIINFSPDIIVIMLGTNDACQNNKQWPGKEIFMRDYKDMIAQFKKIKSNPKIYLCLPVPAYPGDIGRREVVHPSVMLPAIRQVAKETNCQTIDLFTPLSNHRNLFPDKIHPNPQGHQLIANQLYTALTGKDTPKIDYWKIPKDKNKFHIFILMGQSNMAGWRYGSKFEDRIPVPHIVALPSIYKGKLKWKPAANPLNNSGNNPKRFALSIPFAKEYLKNHPGVTIGLLPCARGGYSIDKLKKGSTVYKDFQKKLAFAQKYGVVKATLWHQGESDTVTLAKATTYEKKLHQLIQDVRQDVDNPKLPFVVGNLAEFYGTGKEHNAPQRVKQIKIVRQALRELPKKVPYTGFVESSKLKSVDKQMIHFNHKSYEILGKRYEKVVSPLIAKTDNTIRIACVGDSITYGDRLKHRQKECFPSLLSNMLGKKYTVGNFGIGGFVVRKKRRNSYNTPRNMKKIADFYPSVIVVMLGTNDAAQTRNQWAGKEIFINDYKDLIKQFQAMESKPKIYICLPVPAYPGARGKRELIHPAILIPAIKQVAKETNCQIIDLYTPLSNHQKLFPDKIHPNPEGHKIIANKLLQILKKKTKSESNTLDLAGQWQFKLGLLAQEKTFAPADKPVIIPANLTDTIQLPGTTDTNHKGIKSTTATKGTYTRRYKHIGRAWYKRTIIIPQSFANKELELFLERVLWQSSLYIDGKPYGKQDSLATPHIYKLGKLKAGKHTLIICIDNSMIHNIGDKSHSYSENMQTIWNGILGKIEIRPLNPIQIKAIRSNIVSTKPAFTGTLLVQLQNKLSTPTPATVTIKLTDPDLHTTTTTNHKITIQTEEYILKLPLPKQITPWDEFNHKLYHAEITITTNNTPKITTTWQNKLGFCHTSSDGTHITINGKPTFLRGNLDNCHFPLTGHPPLNKDDWLRVWNIYKQFGLNHVRFHSWCPPEAAFAAADEVGIYIQAEAGVWLDNWMKTRVASKPQGISDENPDVKKFITNEMTRIIDTYGHHPSFIMFCIGNELGSSDFTLLGKLVSATRKHDGTTRLYSCSTARRLQPEIDDFFVSHKNPAGYMRGLRGPRTAWTYDKIKRGAKTTPLILHELGQWPVFPRWSEIDKYTGVVEAKNLQKFKLLAQKGNILKQDAQLQEASGKFSVLLYKAEMEGALRSKTYAGFHLLGIQDYMGQGEAMIGILDMFYDLKPGIITPKQYRQFCAPVVPLAQFAKYVWKSGETFTALAQVSNFSADKIEQNPTWTLSTNNGKLLAKGRFTTAIPQGTVTDIGTIKTKLQTNIPLACTLQITIPNTPYKNNWHIWIYPQNPNIIPNENVLIRNSFDSKTKKALKDGKSVVLFASDCMTKFNSQANRFFPVYWSVGWFRGQKRTLGLLCQNNHPLFKYFPSEKYCDWQWLNIFSKASVMLINNLEPNYFPIVQPIDDFHRGRKLATIFESKVGKGKLIVCVYPIEKNLKFPACKQLYSALIQYAGSKDFKPTAEIPIAWLEKNLIKQTIQKIKIKPIHVLVAQKLKKQGKIQYSSKLDMIKSKKNNYDYKIIAEDSCRLGKKTAAVGKSITLTINVPNTQGVLYVKFHDSNKKARTGKIVFEGKNFILKKHIRKNSQWQKFDVIREDTLDHTLSLKATVTTGPDLQLEEFYFIPKDNLK